MKTIAEICSRAASLEPKTIAIAGISREEISLVEAALEKGGARFILVDNPEHIKSLLIHSSLPGSAVEVAGVENAHQAPAEVMRLVKQGKADLPMKGQVHTSAFLKALLDKEQGFSSGSRLSQITMFDGYNNQPQYLTDCAIHISPTLQEKIGIIQNALEVFSAFSHSEPLIALLGAVETVSEKMPDTLESAILTQMNRRGQIPGCVIDGPLSLDNAISEEFATIKQINSPVAGKAQILVSSDIREANNVSKAIIHYAKREACSIIAGTTLPVIMTSRTDLPGNKLNTIAVACYMLHQQQASG